MFCKAEVDGRNEKKSIVLYSWVSKILEQNMHVYVSGHKLICFH